MGGGGQRPGITPHSILREGEWAPQPVWTDVQERNLLPSVLLVILPMDLRPFRDVVSRVFFLQSLPCLLV